MAISSPYNDNKLTLTEAIALLDNEVGKFCHGRFVRLEPLTTDRKISEIREAPAAAIHHGCTSLSRSRYAGDQYARLEETPGTEVGSASDMV